MQDVLISKCLSIRLKIEMEVQGARCKVQAQDGLHPVPCTLFPVPCSLHPVPYTPVPLHPAPYPLYPYPPPPTIKIPEAKPPPGFG